MNSRGSSTRPNPLAQLTHERRLSALGPGGLNRKRAGFEVRDVHISHYGRICPIETPEGTNIGLISSLMGSTAARRRVRLPRHPLPEDGQRQDWRRASSVAARPTKESNALSRPGRRARRRPASSPRGRRHRPLARRTSTSIPDDQVQFIDIAPKQMVGVSAGLIPFLEHDDANRALMGSNMQRQAVPLLVTEPPIVATGSRRRARHVLRDDPQCPADGHGDLRRRRPRIMIDHNRSTRSASTPASTSGCFPETLGCFRRPLASSRSNAAWNSSGASTWGEWPYSGNSTSVALGMARAAARPRSRIFAEATRDLGRRNHGSPQARCGPCRR